MGTTVSYKTKQRENILSCIKSFDGAHFTADELARRLQDGGFGVGKTTVYRCLDRMTGDGSVRKYLLGDKDSACYQYIAGGCTEHFHLKCTCCGKLIHAECEYLSKIAEHIGQHHGFEVNSSKTVFYGICLECKGENV